MFDLPKVPRRLSGPDNWFGRMRDYVASLLIIESGDIKPTRTNRGTELRIKTRSVAGGGTVKRYLVRSVQNDWLVCEDPPGEGTETGIRIAKPWRLQRTPFDGKTIDFLDERNNTYSATYAYTSPIFRSVTILGVAELQVVIPRIKVGFDYIFAIKAENGTGVTGVDLIDLNADGRAWAKES